jgi:hypothetical protein
MLTERGVTFTELWLCAITFALGALLAGVLR